MTALALRPYQQEAIDRTLAAAERGVRRQLGVAAVGLGKTIVFASLARQMNCRTLVLAHRDELVSQAVDKIHGQWPEATIGIVKAERNDVDAMVVVASVQTLGRAHRLAQLVDNAALWSEPFGLVICDESHHAAAPTYRAIFEGLKAGEPDGPLLLGVTATPDRGDGKGLDEVFAEVTWNYDMLWGIRSGYLSDIRAKRIIVEALDLKGVKIRNGDFAEGDLGRRLMDAGAPDGIVRAWREHASDRRTLVFSPTVAMAEAVAAEFVGEGVSAACVSGTTDIGERRATLAAFESGAIQVLSNCMIATEGYDNPRIDCVILARPTRSRALFTQMIGRGSRRHPDKKDLLVLDMTGVSLDHSLVSVPSLFGVEKPEFERKLGDGSQSVTEVLDEFEREAVRAGLLRAEDVELFAKVRSEIAWVAVHEPGGRRRYERSMGKDRDGLLRPTVRLVQVYDGDRYTCSLRIQGEHGGGVIQSLIVDVPLETAQAVGEDWIRSQGGLGLVASNAPWRAKAPSPKAAAFARSLKVWVEGMSAGECSDAIDAKMAQRRTGGRR